MGRRIEVAVSPRASAVLCTTPLCPVSSGWMGDILYRIHGLQFSPRLDVRRSAARSIWRGAAADQSHVLLVDNAERMGVEVERPFALFGLLDSDHFASQ